MGWIIAKIVLAVLMLLSGIGAIVLVLLQSSNSDGTSALSGGGNKEAGDSFYQRNKGKRKEEVYKLWTFILAGVLAVCSIVFFIISL